MDGCQAARVPGVPCIDEIEGRGVSDLTDDDSRRAKAHGSRYELLPRRYPLTDAQANVIRRLALQFLGVLDDIDAVSRLGDHPQESVRERRLSRAGAAADKNVRP